MVMEVFLCQQQAEVEVSLAGGYEGCKTASILRLAPTLNPIVRAFGLWSSGFTEDSGLNFALGAQGLGSAF